MAAEFDAFLTKSGRTDFVNDFRFWMEVQKFKNICHAQGSVSLMREKVRDCRTLVVHSQIYLFVWAIGRLPITVTKKCHSSFYYLRLFTLSIAQYAKTRSAPVLVFFLHAFFFLFSLVRFFALCDTLRLFPLLVCLFLPLFGTELLLSGSKTISCCLGRKCSLGIETQAKREWNGFQRQMARLSAHLLTLRIQARISCILLLSLLFLHSLPPRR